jgi:uncharacterized protein
MAVNSLVQYPRDAWSGRSDALYNLGLAYSTGQGLAQECVAAYKRFDIGSHAGSDLAKRSRNQIASEWALDKSPRPSGWCATGLTPG